MEQNDNVQASRSSTKLRQRLGVWLESPRVHQIVIALTLLDICIVLAEIVFDLFDNHHCGEESEDGHLGVVLEMCSFAIVCIFVLEITLKLFSFGISYLMESKFNLFDVLVVLSTFVLLLIFHGRGNEAVGLLIALRFWRVLRLVDAVIISIKDGHKHEIAQLQAELLQCHKQIAEFQLRLLEGDDATIHKTI